MAVFATGYAYIECPNCGGKMQALTEFDYGLDTNCDRLTAIAQSHWARCTPQNPWQDDPELFYS